MKNNVIISGESRMSEKDYSPVKKYDHDQILDLSRTVKLLVSSYAGDGDEGYPYY